MSAARERTAGATLLGLCSEGSFHLIKAGDVGNFELESLFPSEAHREESGAVLGHVEGTASLRTTTSVLKLKCYRLKIEVVKFAATFQHGQGSENVIVAFTEILSNITAIGERFAILEGNHRRSDGEVGGNYVHETGTACASSGACLISKIKEGSVWKTPCA